MDVWWVPPVGTMERHDVAALKDLLERPEGFCWVDIAHCDEQAAGLLSGVFGAHPLAVRDCLESNPTGKVHAYPDSILLVMHSPEPGERGQVRLAELDQLVAARYLVTVHGPLVDGPHGRRLGRHAAVGQAPGVVVNPRQRKSGTEKSTPPKSR